MTSDTVFHIGSLTKAFTGACINQLRSKGLIQLDDFIHKHLPEAKSRDLAISSLGTITDLPGHRTGLQQTYHEYLKENILDPLSMTRTFITKGNGLPDNMSLAMQHPGQWPAIQHPFLQRQRQDVNGTRRGPAK